MHGKFLKCLNSQREPPTKALFIPSPLAFDGLRDDIKFLLGGDYTRSYLKNCNHKLNANILANKSQQITTQLQIMRSIKCDDSNSKLELSGIGIS